MEKLRIGSILSYDIKCNLALVDFTCAYFLSLINNSLIYRPPPPNIGMT